jgi:hypothetical protein
MINLLKISILVTFFFGINFLFAKNIKINCSSSIEDLKPHNMVECGQVKFKDHKL